MGLSRHFRSMVRTPGPNDPVDVSRQGNITSMDFGLDAQEAFGQLPAPVTQSERGAEALLKAMGRIPDMPRDLMRMNSQQRQKIEYEPSMSIGDLRMMDEQAMSAKPAENYGRNSGGTGSAGRGTQFGDMPGLQPLEMNDKPWELDDNTNADVQSGVSLTPKPEENVVDKEPDLQSPRGLYQALAKKYPDILTQNLDQLQKSRVTEEDLEGLSDRAGLGSLFIAASKAASGAGSIGGKTAESIAPTIVNREDTLARQRLKDRMDVASENMQMNAKAVDLAMKQIDFADEREQYDPNSDVSQFARDFMKQEFKVNVPANVPAYQLKNFLPAIVQKYQADERASYQAALLGYKETPEQEAKRRSTETEAKQKFESTESEKDRKLRADIAKQSADARRNRGNKVEMFGDSTKAQMNAEMDLAKAFSNEDVVKSFSKVKTHANRLFELARNSPTASNDEALIVEFNKVIDEGSVVKEGEFARTAEGGGLWTKWKNKFGRYKEGTILQPSQRDTIVDTVKTILSGIQPAYEQKKEFYRERANKYKLDPAMIIGVESTPSASAKPSGLTKEETERKNELLRRQRGGK